MYNYILKSKIYSNFFLKKINYQHLINSLKKQIFLIYILVNNLFNLMKINYTLKIKM